MLVQNVARMVWNVGRPLLNSNPELVADAKKAKWVQREVEVEPEPEPKGVKDKKGAKGGKKAVSPKKPGSPGRPGSKGKKDTATAPGDEGTKTKLFWMQEGGELSVARCLRGILVRCNELVAMVRSGRLLHSKMVPEDAMLERDAKSGLTFQIHGRRPSTATPLGSESSEDISALPPSTWQLLPVPDISRS